MRLQRIEVDRKLARWLINIDMRAAAPRPSALVSAVRSGDLVQVSSLLGFWPKLRRARRSCMGDVSHAKLGVSQAEPSSSQDVMQPDDAVTDAAEALAAATIAGRADIVVRLLQQNADPNVPHGADQHTCYHLACIYDHADCLEAIVRAGVDEPRLDRNGKTGIELAQACGCPTVLARINGPLAELRKQRLQAKNERRRVERGKRALLSRALQAEARIQERRTRPRGLFLELGVASGSSINYIAKRAPKGIIVHGFDSFEGLPEHWRDDRKGPKEDHAGFFDRDGELPNVESNVWLHSGWFDQTIAPFLAAQAADDEAEATSSLPLHVSFLHVDCDLYSSTTTALRELAPAIGVGTVIVFDDWGGYQGSEEHEAKAWGEFVDENDVSYEWIDAPPANGTPASSTEPHSKALHVTAIRHARRKEAVAPVEDGEPQLLTFLATTNNVPYRKCASELESLLPSPHSLSVSVTTRGVVFKAPSMLTPSLCALHLPERIYAVVMSLPPSELPDPLTCSGEELLRAVASIVTDANREPQWALALEAHRALHPHLTDLSFAVIGLRRGRLYESSTNSLELGRIVGEALNDKFKWIADLDDPMLQVRVSLNDDGLFVCLALLRRDDGFDCRTAGGLDPHTSWAMVKSVGNLPSGALIIDPMCGKAAILLEAVNLWPAAIAIGLDCDDHKQLECAKANRAALPPTLRERLMLLHGDAGALPFGENVCDAIVCDLPFEVVSRFGYSLDTSRGSTLAKCACEFARVLKPAGKVVLLTSEEQAPNVHEALMHAALAVTCERPCPLGFTKAVIIIAGHKDDNAASATEATRGGLPWESAHGRRSEWHVMRKEGRAPMIPWASSQGEKSVSLE